MMNTNYDFPQGDQEPPLAIVSMFFPPDKNLIGTMKRGRQPVHTAREHSPTRNCVSPSRAWHTRDRGYVLLLLRQ